MYGRKGNHHEVTIDGKTFWVDSNQEETLIRLVEENGFHDRWRHIDYGFKVNQNHYTPDLELSVQLPDNMTHRAIVESKPTLQHLEVKQKTSMRKAAEFYKTDLLLLYVHDIKKWYRIDIKSGGISEFSVPTPGIIPINKLYNPWTKKAPNIYYHHYRQRLELGKTATLIILDLIESSLRTVFGAPKKRKSRHKKRPKTKKY